MELKKVLDPFVCMAFITMVVSGWIVYDVYFNQNYVTFITEEDISSMKDAEFSFFASLI